MSQKVTEDVTEIFGHWKARLAKHNITLEKLLDEMHNLGDMHHSFAVLLWVFSVRWHFAFM